MSVFKNVFGVNDTDESLKSKSSGKFGLNHGFVSLIEFTDKAGKDSSDGDAVDINITIKDREYRRRLYVTTGSLFGKNNTQINPGEEGYEDLFFEDMSQKIAVVKHALKSVGVTQQAIDVAVSMIDPSKIGEGLKLLLSTLPTNYKTVPVDVFLEYQWTISDGQDRTYIELPKNMKGGYFLVQAVKPIGEWVEVKDEEGLHYLDGAKNKHVFTRNSDYMASNKANQQGVGAVTSSNVNMQPTVESAKKATW